MAEIILESWEEGLEKVSLTKLQMEMLGSSLKAAKSNVDFLLDGKIVTIKIENYSLAQEFLKKSELIVSCYLQSSASISVAVLVCF